MNGMCIDGLVIPIGGGAGLSRNVREGVGTMEISLNDADLRVARAMGVDPKAVARIKYKHGKGGISGIALHTDIDGYLGTGLGKGPIPETNPGRLDSRPGVPIRKIVEPEDSDAERVKDPAGLMVRPIGVKFPV